MLCLTRYPDQSIMIGDNIKITVIKIRGDRVSVGITAPQKYPVHREEIYKIIQQEKRSKTNDRRH